MSTSLSSSKSAEVEVPTDLSPPVLLSRSDTAITVRLPRVENAKLYRVEYSEYGYLYYTWIPVETTGRNYTIKDLRPNTSYVARVSVAVMGKSGKDLVWSQPSPLSDYMRTFTSDESAKRESTYFEHALKLERDERTRIQAQLEKLQAMTADHKTQHQNDFNTLLGQLGRSTNLKEALDQQRLRYVPEETKASDVQELQSKVEKLEQLLKTKEDETAGLMEAKERELEDMMQECRRAVEDASERALARQAQMETALGEAIRDAQQQLQQKNEIMQILQEENKELAQKVETLTRELCDADAAAAQTNQELEDEVHRLQIENRKLQNELNDLRAASMQNSTSS